MDAVSNIYLIIFLPLLSSLFCQFFKKKSSSFWFTCISCFAVLIFSLKIFPDIIAYEEIISDLSFSTLSLALEFKLDLLGNIFLILLSFLKIAILLFYKNDIDRSLDAKNNSIFYSVFLLHLFSLVGIFTANNLLNLFLFFEIYSFSFFATLSISSDKSLLKVSFKYFALSVFSSLILLFSFFAIYLVFGESNIAKIATSFALLKGENNMFLWLIFSLIIFALVIKFFPLWLYFEKIKSTRLISNFLAVESLFIKTNIGIYLALKFSYFFFGGNLFFSEFDFDIILLFCSLSLIFYSSVKLYKQKHLKVIVAYLCLNNLGFIFAAISLQTMQSLQALFFYLLNFNLINFFLFIFASFLKKYSQSSSITGLKQLDENYVLLSLPLKLVIFFIAGFPLTILFFANWNLVYNSFVFDFEIFLIIAVFVSTFAQSNFAIKLINAFFAGSKKKIEINKDRYVFYLLSFWFLTALIYLTFFLSSFVNALSVRLASYLLSNSL